MNCQTGILNDFESRTEAMGLNCPYGNAEGIKFNDLISCGQTLVCIGVLSLAVSINNNVNSCNVAI